MTAPGTADWNKTMQTTTKRYLRLRQAFTLIELLIAMALTLIIVYAIAEFYAYVGNSVRDSRAMIELGGQLRAAGKKLQIDLDSLTLRPEPWIDAFASPGYFSVYEGPCSDMAPDNGTSNLDAGTSATDPVPDLVDANVTTLVGDGDDILAMTIRSNGLPFEAQYYNSATMNYQRVTSQFAEVIWYTTFTDLNANNIWDIGEPRFLCRRQLVIVPSLGTLALPPNPNTGMTMTLAEFKQSAEVSFRVNSTGQPIANSLADLSVRHNRFGCWATNGFGETNYAPLQMNPTTVDTSNAGNITLFSLQGDKFGEDRVLSNLLAFDVRVWDPNAPIYADSESIAALGPGDPGYQAASSGTAIGYGAWVDLYYRRGMTSPTMTSHFSHNSQVPRTSGAAFAQNYVFARWDTWPTLYEIYGSGASGQSLDGLDNNNSNGVDDSSERETQPPYAAPLRGVQARLRVYEPQTRQARQVTIATDFIAE